MTDGPLDIAILPFNQERDSFEDLRALLNLAYSGWIAKGIKFGAATQGVEATKRRILEATACWVALVGSEVVGTICYYDHRRYDNEPEWYSRDDVGHFGHFAVHPRLQRSGIGSRLVATAEARAIADKKLEFSCDTAENAVALVDMYTKRGLRIVGTHQWRGNVFRNVVMSKRLG